MPLTRFNRFVVVGCGAFLLLAGLASALAAQDARFGVPFLTVRDLGAPESPSLQFGDARGTLRAGRCELEAVDTGALSGIVENGPAFLREQLLNIEEVALQVPDDLLAGVQAQAPGALTLYVHGYFIDFEKGCRRAALLQQNASLAQRMVWFTWPSDGDIANYMMDEADLYWSVPYIADAILALNARSAENGGADVIGHSLGGRGVALALAEIAYRAPDTRLGDVVLLAPDMDFEVFAGLLPRIRPIAKTITLYVSDADRPLDLSEELHGYPRLGQAGNDVAALRGVDVIDVSLLTGGSASGHLYHIHDPDVGRDLDMLLNGGQSAKERAHLEAVGPNLWRFTAQ
ncbi:alpha/beta hydrolase [Roseobacteraceae bacterium S113]